MELVAFWLIFAVIVGVAAGARGRNGFGWFLLAVIISPLLAIILVLVIPSLKAPPRAAQSRGAATKACPRCAEDVKAAANVCRYCGFEFPPKRPAVW